MAQGSLGVDGSHLVHMIMFPMWDSTVPKYYVLYGTVQSLDTSLPLMYYYVMLYIRDSTVSKLLYLYDTMSFL